MRRKVDGEERHTEGSDRAFDDAEFDRRTLLGSITAGALGLGLSGRVAASRGEPSGRQTPNEQVGPKLVEADEEAGFNFPYYLYVPSDAREKPLLVEPVNSGTASDNFQEDLDAGERTASGGVARRVCDALRVALVVPVFANPASDGFYEKFVQSLDTETMHIDSGRFERIDRQLLAMVDDARDRLAEDGLDLPEEFMMNGFSASGNFVDNFAVMHPERLASVTAGAVNGMPTLPHAEAKGHRLNYQIGIADLEELIGKPFDLDAWRAVPLSCYMGETERSPSDDTIPYRDVWSAEQAEKALAVYGEDMQEDRMTYSEAMHHRVDAGTRFEVYDDTDHEYSPEIVSDIVSFHRRHNGIEEVSFAKDPAAGMEELPLDVFVSASADDTDLLEARAFRDGTDVTADAATVVPGVSNQRGIQLTDSLSLGDDVTVSVVEPGSSDLSAAVLTDESTVRYEAQFATDPQAGDTEVEVSYGMTEEGRAGALYLVPDGDGPYWQRDVRLRRVRPGDSGVETFSLSAETTGVPFEEGDEVQVWLVPAGNIVPSRAVATDSVTLGSTGDGGATRQASTCDVESMDHEQVDIGFASAPTVGDGSVTVETTVAESFGKDARTRLFPETGGGQWGIGLDFVSPGTDGTTTYDVSPRALTLGETATLRAFPEDWSTLEDTIALECTVVSGIQFRTVPRPGATEVPVEYYYPGDAPGPGEVRLTIDGDQTVTLASVEPGAFESRTLSLDDADLDDGLPGGAELELSLVPAGGREPVDTAVHTIGGGEAGSVSFVDPPAAHSRSLAVEYELAEDYDGDRPALRLYTETGSSWGILLEETEPGDDRNTTLEVNPDETGVPFRPGHDVEVALVEGTDPYARVPVATASTTVRESSVSTGGAESTETPTAEPGDTATGTVTTEPGDTVTDTVTAESVDTVTAERTDPGTVTDSGGEPAEAAATKTDIREVDTAATDDGGTATATSGPGFGIGSALASLGGAAYLLKRRLADDGSEE